MHFARTEMITTDLMHCNEPNEKKQRKQVIEKYSSLSISYSTRKTPTIPESDIYLYQFKSN